MIIELIRRMSKENALWGAPRIYGRKFRRKLTAIEIKEVISTRKSPWQKPHVERVIGSIHRECTDHVIVLGEQHLLRTFLKYPRRTTTRPAVT